VRKKLVGLERKHGICINDGRLCPRWIKRNHGQCLQTLYQSSSMLCELKSEISRKSGHVCACSFSALALQGGSPIWWTSNMAEIRTDKYKAQFLQVTENLLHDQTYLQNILFVAICPACKTFCSLYLYPRGKKSRGIP